VSGPRSMHTGGAQLSLCDGSVRFVSENVDRVLFRNVFSRDDGRVIGEF
jgi:prepilin-type processing-associated H-X9-DG protein